jgi:hypothetical protein
MAGLDKASQQARAGGKSGSKRGNDATGWKRGACGIDGNETVKLNRATDYAARGISAVSFGEPMDADTDVTSMWKRHTWRSASIKQGSGPPRFRPKSDAGTSPAIQRISPRSKYGKKAGGYGQRTGD